MLGMIGAFLGPWGVLVTILLASRRRQHRRHRPDRWPGRGIGSCACRSASFSPSARSPPSSSEARSSSAIAPCGPNEESRAVENEPSAPRERPADVPARFPALSLGRAAPDPLPELRHAPLLPQRHGVGQPADGAPRLGDPPEGLRCRRPIRPTCSTAPRSRRTSSSWRPTTRPGRRIRGRPHELQAPGDASDLAARPAAGCVVEWSSAPAAPLRRRRRRPRASTSSRSTPARAPRCAPTRAPSRSSCRSPARCSSCSPGSISARSSLPTTGSCARRDAAPPAAPGGPGAPDERDFLIARFEATIAALSEKERELERLARAEKERADDMEIAARTLARNLPTGLLSVDRAGAVVELNEAGREILALSGRRAGGALSRRRSRTCRNSATSSAAVLEGREAVGRREAHWGEPERVLGVTVTPGDGRRRPVSRRPRALFRSLRGPPPRGAASPAPGTSRTWARSPRARRTSSATRPPRSTASPTSRCATPSAPPST